MLAAMLVATFSLARLNLGHNQQTLVEPAGGSLFTAVLTDVPVLLRYLKNTVCPTALSIFYYVAPVSSVADVRLWASALALVAIVAGTVWLSARRRLTIFLWLWFAGALGPALNLIPLPFLMQDRYAYFALPALLLISAGVAVSAAARLKTRIVVVLPTVALSALAGLAAVRSDVFENDLLLYRDAVAQQPESAYARTFLALTLAETADVLDLSGSPRAQDLRALRQDALIQVNAALAAPDFARMIDPGRVYVLRGVLQERLGQDDEALETLRNALLRPQKSYNRLYGALAVARVKLRQGQPQAALLWAEKGIAWVGGAEASPEAVFLKGQCYEQMGEIDMAISCYQSIPRHALAWPRATERLSVLCLDKAHVNKHAP
jgi:tetratricopeptide (TPR) repeat protein